MNIPVTPEDFHLPLPIQQPFFLLSIPSNHCSDFYRLFLNFMWLKLNRMMPYIFSYLVFFTQHGIFAIHWYCPVCFVCSYWCVEFLCMNKQQFIYSTWNRHLDCLDSLQVGPLWKSLLEIFIYMSFGGHINSLFFDNSTVMDLLGHRVSIYLALMAVGKHFSKGLNQLEIFGLTYASSSYSIFSPNSDMSFCCF